MIFNHWDSLTFVQDGERLRGLQPVFGGILMALSLNHVERVGMARILGLVSFAAMNDLTVNSDQSSWLISIYNYSKLPAFKHGKSNLFWQDKQWNWIVDILALDGHKSASLLNLYQDFLCICDERRYYAMLWWIVSIRFQGLHPREQSYKGKLI